jgi:hypothetical protein
MRRRAEIQVASSLAAAPAAVWERVTSADGVNFELGPLLRMTVPRGVDELDLAMLGPGRLGRSWVLLLGVLPIDYDDIALARVEPGRGFVEESTMLSQRRWRHARTLAAGGEGTVLVDRVAWEPRLPLPGAMMRPLFAAIFAHRHSRLRRWFGGAALPR